MEIVNKVEWNAVREEVTNHLQELIRIDTTNPPGNEIRCADYIAGVLRSEGIEYKVTESTPGRGNVTARLEGGRKAPLMLLGHTDVVAAESEKWTHPPISGELVEGVVWGRGALDMKNMVAAELMVFLLFRRLGLSLNRDLIYAATADEEAGKGNHGIGWLLDNFPDQVEAPYVLTEGGGNERRIGNTSFFTIQTGQKGICRFRLHARGRPGHGSVPHRDNAVVKLSRVVAALGQTILPIHPSPTLKAYIEGIAEHQNVEAAERLRAILDSEKSEKALSQAPLPETEIASLNSLLRNTVSPTIIAAGTKINVIPGDAVAWVDGRLAPGQTEESFFEEIYPFLGKDVFVEVDQYSPPIEAEIGSALYETIVSVMGEHVPEARIIPSIMTGGTDAKHIIPRKPETQVLGFMPLREMSGKDEEANLIHGHNERISVENLLFATKVLFDVVKSFCGVAK